MLHDTCMSVGDGGGLYAAIGSDVDVSSSSMSLTTVTATGNTAGTMRWAPTDSMSYGWCQWIPSGCVCTWVRDGGFPAVCSQYCVSRPRC